MNFDLFASAQKKLLLVAHRGAWGGNIPCNNIIAYEFALTEGADMIEIDVLKRTIHVELTEEELAERKKNFSWSFPAEKYPRFLRLFVKNVGSMAKGGIWE